ncbi:MAG TPA: hypothetical protein VFH88_03195 [Candidatus Krumholzibacteria bacterium]|nr:hypothetical protein [Candidatus Krumholzibacteria bacterium]
MRKALAGVLAVALIGVLAGSAMAQVPNIQVYFDAAATQTQTDCGTANTVANLYVVMNNWNFSITGVDFTIEYPSVLTWLGDNLPDPLTQVAIGNSPTGIAIAYANCCPLDGFTPALCLIPSVLWGPCDCNTGPKAVVVHGYGWGTPSIEKPYPTAIRKDDYAEFTGIGMTSLICPGNVAVQETTWGQVKALYR